MTAGSSTTSPSPKKTSRRSLRFFPLIIFVCFFFSTQAFAKVTQMHVRSGYTRGDYDGVISGEFSELTTMDLEYETVFSNTNSFFFRTMAVFEGEKSMFRYFYLGGGMKHYFGSKAMRVEAEGRGTLFLASPVWRYYAGFDVGISHIVLKTFGEFLQISTSAYEYGPTAGIIYNLTSRMGLELNATVKLTTGFTTVSIGGTTYSALAGISYYLD